MSAREALHSIGHSICHKARLRLVAIQPLISWLSGLRWKTDHWPKLVGNGAGVWWEASLERK